MSGLGVNHVGSVQPAIAAIEHTINWTLAGLRSLGSRHNRSRTLLLLVVQDECGFMLS